MNKRQRIACWKTIDVMRARMSIGSRRFVSRTFEREARKVSAAANKAGAPADVLELASTAVDLGAPAWTETIGRDIYLRVGDAFASRSFAQIAKGIIRPLEFRQEPGVAVLDPTAAVADAAAAQWTVAIEGFLETELAAKVTSVGVTTKKHIGRVVNQGLQEGFAVQKIARNIRAEYKSFTPSRSLTIARTETLTASNLGSQEGARATELPLKKEWLATPDDLTREAHIAADGQKQNVDEPYSVDGEQLMFPLDGSLGASAGNIINCRCTEVYAVDRSAA